MHLSMVLCAILCFLIQYPAFAKSVDISYFVPGKSISDINTDYIIRGPINVGDNIDAYVIPGQEYAGISEDIILHFKFGKLFKTILSFGYGADRFRYLSNVLRITNLEPTDIYIEGIRYAVDFFSKFPDDAGSLSMPYQKIITLVESKEALDIVWQRARTKNHNMSINDTNKFTFMNETVFVLLSRDLYLSLWIIANGNVVRELEKMRFDKNVERLHN